MKKFILFLLVSITLLAMVSCQDYYKSSAVLEQEKTEINQLSLNQAQPAPRITWSLERDNLIKRFKLQNDRTVMFYMYLFIEGIADPIGYYQVNKVSSVNSQLTNTSQLAIQKANTDAGYEYIEGVLPSPAEDGSYGTNGDAVFGFTPEDIYIEHNMKYVVSTVPLSFRNAVNRLTVINAKDEEDLKKIMDKLK